MYMLIVSATAAEIEPLRQKLSASWITHQNTLTRGEVTVEFLITGVGIHATTYALTWRLLTNPKPTLAIQAGIGGAINPAFRIGETYHVISEEFGDLGAEDKDGSFLNAFDLGLVNPDSPPYQAGKLLNQTAREYDFLPRAAGITVNKVHGSAESISKLRSSTDADIESMEGAAFFYVCLLREVPFLEIRSISNLVEPRDRAAWNIPLAVDSLANHLLEIINIL